MFRWVQVTRGIVGTLGPIGQWGGEYAVSDHLLLGVPSLVLGADWCGGVEAPRPH